MELLTIGMALARRCPDEATMPDTAAAVAVFEKVSRAVRRTVRMVRWLDEPLPVRRVDGADRVAARKLILRAVEDRIDQAAETDEADLLHDELLERLDAPELEAELAGRPVAEIIGEICRDLGLDRWPESYPSLRRRPADVTALHLRAVAPVGATQTVAAPHLVLASRALFTDDLGDNGLHLLSDEELEGPANRRPRPPGGPPRGTPGTAPSG